MKIELREGFFHTGEIQLAHSERDGPLEESRAEIKSAANPDHSYRVDIFYNESEVFYWRSP